MGFLRSFRPPLSPRSVVGRGYAVVFFFVLFSQSNGAGQTSHKQRTLVPHNDLQQHYDAGRTFQLSGDQERAAAEYKTFLAEALRQIGNAWIQAHEFAKADMLFKAALTILPHNTQLNLNYAALRLQQGNPKEAQIFAETALAGAPEDPQVQYMLGSALFQQQDYKGAREHLEKAVVTSPKFEIGYLLGLTYIRLNDLNRATVLFNEMVIGLGDTPEIHVLFGRAYREGDFLDEAVAELKKAISKDSKTKMAHYLLAMAYLERDGDSGFVEAVPEFDAELKINPQDARTHYMEGYIALKRHNAKLAESELTRAAELDPGNPDPLISLGQLYTDSNRLPEAEKAFRRAILLTKDPTRNGYQINRAHYSLGRILLQTGREDEGKRELQISAELRDKPHAQARGSDDVPNTPAIDTEKLKSSGTGPSSSPEDAKKIKAFADELGPAIADSYNNLGVIAAGTQDFVSAMDYFAEAGEWNPNLQTLDRNKGMAAFYANRFDAAVEPLSKHIKRQPEDLRARAALGLSLFGMKRYGQVLETLEPIKKDVDGDPGLSYAYAVSQVKTGAYPEGIARLRTLEKADPQSADVHTLLGEAFVDQGEYAEALDEYHLALSINPGLQRTHFLAGLALIRQGNPTEAAEELRRALKLDPADVDSKYQLAFSLVQMQKREEALPLLRELIQQDPKYADAYYQLGKLQLEQGDTEQAISNLEKGTRLNPESDYTHYQLALAYRRQSRTDDAEREMQTYRALKNRHRGRDAAQQN
jgi:tetratricopeptide (TPR) repeat protein